MPKIVPDLQETDPLETARNFLAASINQFVDFAQDCETAEVPDTNKLWAISQKMAQAGADFLWSLDHQETHEAATKAAEQLRTLVQALSEVDRSSLLALFHEDQQSDLFDCLNDAHDAASDWVCANSAHTLTAIHLRRPK